MVRLMAGTAIVALFMAQGAQAQEAPQTFMIDPSGEVVTNPSDEVVRGAAEMADSASRSLENAVQDAQDLGGPDLSEMVMQVPPQEPLTAPAPLPNPAPTASSTPSAVSPRPVTRLPPAPQPPVRAFPAASSTPAPVAVNVAPAPASPEAAPAPAPADAAPLAAAVDPAAAPAEASGEPAPPPVVLAPTFNTAGEIARRSELRREMETIAVDTERLAALQAVVDRIGVDNAVALYPDLAATIAYSPMGLEALKKEITLINEVRALMETKPDEAAEAQAPADPAAIADPSQAASSIMNMPVAVPGAAPTMTRDEVMAMISEATEEEQQAEAEAAQSDSGAAMSFMVSEIYGTEDSMIAVLKAGGSQIKVRQGDELPDGSVVTSVSTTGVSVERDGVSRDMKLR